ncbi:MAG: hypothetical protein KDB07_13290 [Planctomycetes bacterium]|nr:hypothetical protein [Planctomycetota bacterium]
MITFTKDLRTTRLPWLDRHAVLLVGAALCLMGLPLGQKFRADGMNQQAYWAWQFLSLLWPLLVLCIQLRAPRWQTINSMLVVTMLGVLSWAGIAALHVPMKEGWLAQFWAAAGASLVFATLMVPLAAQARARRLGALVVSVATCAYGVDVVLGLIGMGASFDPMPADTLALLSGRVGALLCALAGIVAIALESVALRSRLRRLQSWEKLPNIKEQA